MKYFMKDKINKNKFILNYEKDENNIFVNYADGQRTCIIATEENERKVLECMKQQVIRAANPNLENSVLKTQQRIALFSKFVSISFGTAALVSSAATAIQYCMDSQTLTDSSAKFIGFCIGFSLGSFVVWLRKQPLVDDIKKNWLFLEYSQNFNDMGRTNINLYTGVSRSLQKYISEECLLSEGDLFTLNDMDKFKYSDVQRMVSNYDREEFLEFESSGETEEEISLGLKNRKINSR